MKKGKACFVYYMKFNNAAILYREAKAVADLGYEVDIVCLRNEPSEPILQEFEGLNLYRIQARPDSERQAVVYFFRLLAFLIKTFFLLSWLGIRKKYRIIHVTSPPDIMVFTSLVPKLLGAKVILDIHDIGPEFFMRKLGVQESHPSIRLLKFLERTSARYADHVITVTDVWKEKLGSRSCDRNKVSVLLNVPDESLFSGDRTRARDCSGGLNLFYHGSLEEHFGVDTLLMAMPAVLKAMPNIKLHIYGQGRFREKLDRMCGELELNGKVVIHPHVPFFQLPEILSRDADIGIVPTKGSVFSEEALSMKSLEYISMGIPIVISNTQVHKYYFNDSMVTFFQSDNHEDLANKIIQLSNSINIQKRQVENSRIFMEKHDWKIGKLSYYCVINKLCNN